MFTLERPGIVDDPGRTLHRLELTVMWLWSSEPCCDLAVRSGLIERVGDVSASIEQLVFRHEFHPDESIDPDELAACVAEVVDLCGFWPALDPHPAAAATFVMRTGVSPSTWSDGITDPAPGIAPRHDTADTVRMPPSSCSDPGRGTGSETDSDRRRRTGSPGEHRAP